MAYEHNSVVIVQCRYLFCCSVLYAALMLVFWGSLGEWIFILLHFQLEI